MNKSRSWLIFVFLAMLIFAMPVMGESSSVIVFVDGKFLDADVDPVTATLPYDGDYILYYKDGKYIEVLFGRDFQFYPETKDSYMKIFNEGQEILGSFKKL